MRGNRSAFLAVVGACLFAAGCLRVELRVDEGGSGRVRVDFPADTLLWARNRDIEHLFAGVEIAEASIGQRIVAEMAFKDIADLARLPVWAEFRTAPPSVRRHEGGWEVDLSLRALRDWAMRQRLAGVDETNLLTQVTLHAEAGIGANNARASDGHSAEWEFSILDLWQTAAPSVRFVTGAAPEAIGVPAVPLRPNIILFVADDMGQGDVRAYEPKSTIPTEAMDRIAAGGIRFDHAYAPSAVCTPSRYALLTGRHPFRSTLADAVLRSAYDPPLLDRRHETIAGLLSRAGYRTAAFGKWHLGMRWSNRAGDGVAAAPRGTHTTEDVDFRVPIIDGPLQHGFDSFFGLGSSINHDPYAFIDGDRVTDIPTRMRPAKRVGRADFRPGWVADSWDDSRQGTIISLKALLFITDHVAREPDRPFFLYYAATANHVPYVPPPELHGVPIAGRGGDDNETPARNDMVVENDAILKFLLARIEDPNGDGDRSDSIAANTLVIVASDNGADVAHPGRLRGFKGVIYEGGHRIPMLALWQGRIPTGVVSQQPFSLVDMYATLAALTGTAPAEGAAQDSENILPAFFGEPMERGPILLQKSGLRDVFAVRHGNWKLIVRNERPAELYDLDADPLERNNQIDRSPEVAARLMQEYVRIRGGAVEQNPLGAMQSPAAEPMRVSNG